MLLNAGTGTFDDLRSNLVDRLVLHWIPSQHSAVILAYQPLHKDRQVSKGVIGRNIAQLIAVAQFQQQMKQIGTEAEPLFPCPSR